MNQLSPLIFGFLLLFSLTTLGQEEMPDSNNGDTPTLKKMNIEEIKEKDVVFNVVEEFPSFPGGNEGLFKYINANTKYPPKARENNDQGLVVLTMIIRKDGSINDINVLTSVTPELDAEAIRVVKNMPKWNPGKQGGKNVSVKISFPLRFTLESGGNE